MFCTWQSLLDNSVNQVINKPPSCNAEYVEDGAIEFSSCPKLQCQKLNYSSFAHSNEDNRSMKVHSACNHAVSSSSPMSQNSQVGVPLPAPTHVPAAAVAAVCVARAAQAQTSSYASPSPSPSPSPSVLPSSSLSSSLSADNSLSDFALSTSAGLELAIEAEKMVSELCSSYSLQDSTEFELHANPSLGLDLSHKQFDPDPATDGYRSVSSSQSGLVSPVCVRPLQLAKPHSDKHPLRAAEAAAAASTSPYPIEYTAFAVNTKPFPAPGSAPPPSATHPGSICREAPGQGGLSSASSNSSAGSAPAPAALPDNFRDLVVKGCLELEHILAAHKQNLYIGDLLFFCRVIRECALTAQAYSYTYSHGHDGDVPELVLGYEFDSPRQETRTLVISFFRLVSCWLGVYPCLDLLDVQGPAPAPGHGEGLHAAFRDWQQASRRIILAILKSVPSLRERLVHSEYAVDPAPAPAMPATSTTRNTSNNLHRRPSASSSASGCRHPGPRASRLNCKPLPHPGSMDTSGTSAWHRNSRPGFGHENSSVRDWTDEGPASLGPERAGAAEGGMTGAHSQWGEGSCAWEKARAHRPASRPASKTPMPDHDREVLLCVGLGLGLALDPALAPTTTSVASLQGCGPATALTASTSAGTKASSFKSTSSERWRKSAGRARHPCDWAARVSAGTGLAPVLAPGGGGEDVPAAAAAAARPEKFQGAATDSAHLEAQPGPLRVGCWNCSASDVSPSRAPTLDPVPGRSKKWTGAGYTGCSGGKPRHRGQPAHKPSAPGSAVTPATVQLQERWLPVVPGVTNGCPPPPPPGPTGYEDDSGDDVQDGAYMKPGSYDVPKRPGVGSGAGVDPVRRESREAGGVEGDTECIVMHPLESTWLAALASAETLSKTLQCHEGVGAGAAVSLGGGGAASALEEAQSQPLPLPQYRVPSAPLPQQGQVAPRSSRIEHGNQVGLGRDTPTLAATASGQPDARGSPGPRLPTAPAPDRGDVSGDSKKNDQKLPPAQSKPSTRTGRTTPAMPVQPLQLQILPRPNAGPGPRPGRSGRPRAAPTPGTATGSRQAPDSAATETFRSKTRSASDKDVPKPRKSKQSSRQSGRGAQAEPGGRGGGGRQQRRARSRSASLCSWRAIQPRPDCQPAPGASQSSRLPPEGATGATGLPPPRETETTSTNASRVDMFETTPNLPGTHNKDQSQGSGQTQTSTSAVVHGDTKVTAQEQSPRSRPEASQLGAYKMEVELTNLINVRRALPFPFLFPFDNQSKCSGDSVDSVRDDVEKVLPGQGKPLTCLLEGDLQRAVAVDGVSSVEDSVGGPEPEGEGKGKRVAETCSAFKSTGTFLAA